MVGEMLALASAAFLGFSTALAKNVTPRISAVYLATLRLVIGALLAIVVAFAAGELIPIPQIPLKTLGILLGAGVVVLVGHVLLVKAIALDDVTRVLPATTGLYILLSVVASVLLADEQVSWWTALGGFIVLGGIYLLSISQRRDWGQQEQARLRSGLVALGMAAGVGLAWTIGVLWMDEVVKYMEPMPATAIRMSFMALLILGLAVATGNFRRRSVSKRDMSVVCVSGLLAGASTLTFVAALKWSTPATVVILNSTAPFFVIPLALTWLHEGITRQVVLGTIACFGGIVLTLL